MIPRSVVQQTVSRLVLSTLRERAQHIGLPSARNDAVQAFALLTDYDVRGFAPTLPFITSIIMHKIGCVMTDLDRVSEWVNVLLGSDVRVGVSIQHNDIQMIDHLIDQGIGEIEIVVDPALVAQLHGSRDWFEQITQRIIDTHLTIKIDLTHPDLSQHDVLFVASYATSHQIDVINVPEAMIEQVQRAIHSTTVVKVANVTDLESVRRVLQHGATRIGTPNALELIDQAINQRSLERG